jgi:hypothetical protein
MTQAITWTSVSGAEAYYLYVGTAAGTNDLVNTGAIQQTSTLVTTLPANQTVYARIYVLLAGVWSHGTDISFAAAAPPAPSFTAPTNGAVNVSLAQPISWTTVANAQAYYLYVGTTVGSNDLVNSGEIQQASYAVPTLPSNQVVYARIYSRVAGVWWHSPDISFSMAAPPAPTFVSPAAGATSFDRKEQIGWTTVPGAQAYYLYIGTAVGLNDLINTGEIQQTARNASTLPVNQVVYARIYSKVAGLWFHSPDISFTVTDCSYTLTPLTISAAAAGRTGYLAVTATGGPTCTWTATSNASAHARHTES